ncbi:RHS domain-containing protein, partial [Escherichia coli]|uniref:RHS domain-containing protein n=1 Tax=Escherichia coli TaxID=562 RepID=UPI0021696601
TVEQMQNQMDPVYTPARKIHLYHCDHRGLPLALISKEGATEWCAEYDEWGNLLNEENPHQLQQLIRLPGQQYDEESGLYYNRHRYYGSMWQLLKKVRHFMETASPFPGGKHGQAKV